jgi:hypothetical protein
MVPFYASLKSCNIKSIIKASLYAWHLKLSESLPEFFENQIKAKIMLIDEKSCYTTIVVNICTPGGFFLALSLFI